MGQEERKGQERTFRVAVVLCVLSRVWVTRVCACAETHRLVHVRLEHFIAHKFLPKEKTTNAEL